MSDTLLVWCNQTVFYSGLQNSSRTFAIHLCWRYKNHWTNVRRFFTTRKWFYGAKCQIATLSFLSLREKCTFQVCVLICALVMKNYFFIFQRTPAPSSGLPRNSTPAFSNVSFIFVSVLKLLEGTPSNDSNRIIELKLSPECSAKSFLDQSSIPLAARIWALVIINKKV